MQIFPCKKAITSLTSFINRIQFNSGCRIGPSIVIFDEGKAKTLRSTTLQSDIYAFIFNQKGLMAGLGLQGSKPSKINP